MNNKKVLIDFVLCLCFGMFGAHKFYEKKIGYGILYLFTWGIFGIGWIVDTIKLFIKLLQEIALSFGFIKDYTLKDNVVSESLSNTNEQIEKTVNTFTTREYKIAGVTYENEEGKDIQKETKKILKEYVSEDLIDTDDMFCGYTNSDIKDMDIQVSQYEDIPFDAKIKEDIYDGKPCVKVYIQRADNETYTHIGYIQKRYNQIQEVIDILHNHDNISLTLYVVGGKIKKCESEVDDEYNEKLYVETIDLDYGFRLFIQYK